MWKRQLRHSNVKSVENIKRQNNNHQTHANKALSFFLVPIWRFQHFKYILQNPKLKQIATRFRNDSLGPFQVTSTEVKGHKQEESFSDFGRGALTRTDPIKGILCFVHLNRQQQFQTNKYALLLCKKLSFSSGQFQSIAQIRGHSLGAMEDCTGGQQPCLDWTFLRQKFHKYFLEWFIETKNMLIYEKTF